MAAPPGVQKADLDDVVARILALYVRPPCEWLPSLAPGPRLTDDDYEAIVGKQQKAAEEAKKAAAGPKRPPTAFFLYAKDRRPAIKQAEPATRVCAAAR